MTPEFINAIAALCGAVAWPLIALIVVVMYRKPVARLIQNLDSLTLPGGFEAKLRKVIEQEAEGLPPADPGKPVVISQRQVEAAERVGRITEGKRDIAREQMLELAREYERIRASMDSGWERTKLMGAVVRKMQTLAIACQPYLNEFRASKSPGERLAAVAVLQVTPNWSALDWLADRLDMTNEAPFIGYNAAVALQVAARLSGGKAEQGAVARAIEKALENLGDAPDTADRKKVLQDALAKLKQ